MDGIPLQQFGGGWTDKKLQFLRAYLTKYREALKNQSAFTLYYIDPFAGTGYNTSKVDPNEEPSLFDQDTKKALENSDGSARIALTIPHLFHRYVFIERDQRRYEELLKLKDEFKMASIQCINGDANEELINLCRSWKGKSYRGVVFLDPFGMQVRWETIVAIAETKAIDLWILFPGGLGVMRMLPNNGNFPEGWKEKLDIFFGDSSWYDEFYSKYCEEDLLGSSAEKAVKKADYATIGRFFLNRLKKVFADVADNPYDFYNSSNCPIFSLYFAAGNLRGAPIAKRIAEAILRK